MKSQIRIALGVVIAAAMISACTFSAYALLPKAKCSFKIHYGTIVFPKNVIGVEFNYSGVNIPSHKGKPLDLSLITKNFIYKDSTRNVNRDDLKKFSFSSTAFTDFMLNWQISWIGKLYAQAVEFDTLRTTRLGNIVTISDNSTIYLLDFNDKFDISAALETLRKIKGVEWADEDTGKAIPQSEPNDPDYLDGIEWQLKSDFTPDCDINPQAAWARTDIKYNEDFGSNIIIGDMEAWGYAWNVPYQMDDGDEYLYRGGDVNYASEHGNRVCSVINTRWDRHDFPYWPMLTMAGAHKNCKIISEGSQTGNYSSLAFDINDAVARGAQIIFMPYVVPGNNGTLRTAIQQAYAQYISLFASSGNNDIQSWLHVYPAEYPEVIAVAAHTQIGGHPGNPPFHEGNYIACCAPGWQIDVVNSDGSSAPWSGTSLSVAFGAATAAWILSVNPFTTPAQVRQFITSTCHPSPLMTPEQQGAGMIDLSRATQAALDAFIDQKICLTKIPNQLPCYGLSGHPNPFNNTIAIQFYLPQRDQVSLSVFDIKGRLVSNLVNGWYEPGSHVVPWNGQNNASGVYLVKLQNSGKTETSRAVLVK